MNTIHYKDQEALQSLVSEEFSDWSDSVVVDQKLINDFAELSGDHMWLHVDEERCAKESPFGGTIAHGFLLLSLMPKMTGGQEDITQILTGYNHIVNYGSNKLRFLGSVTSGSAVRSRSRFSSIEVGENNTKVTSDVHVHVEGQDEKPVLIYQLIFVFI
jgi:acyl dehydratase